MIPLFYIDPTELPVFTGDTFSNATTIYVTSTPELDDCTLAVYSQTQVDTLLKRIEEQEKAIKVLMEQREVYCNAYLREKEKNKNGNQP